MKRTCCLDHLCLCLAKGKITFENFRTLLREILISTVEILLCEQNCRTPFQRVIDPSCLATMIVQFEEPLTDLSLREMAK